MSTSHSASNLQGHAAVMTIQFGRVVKFVEKVSKAWSLSIIIMICISFSVKLTNGAVRGRSAGVRRWMGGNNHHPFLSKLRVVKCRLAQMVIFRLSFRTGPQRSTLSSLYLTSDFDCPQQRSLPSYNLYSLEIDRHRTEWQLTA